MHFSKYHALGNDYIVIDPAELDRPLTERQIRRICHRNYGIGSDGILLGPHKTDEADFRLEIFNPDGSEAEKSGNGLRIFSRYLWDLKQVDEKPFTILTKGGKVIAVVSSDGGRVSVEMGQVTFESDKIPVAGDKREVLNEMMTIAGRDFTFCAASVGNPHCVILDEQISARLAQKYGPKIEKEARFPNKTNVQFLKVLDRANIAIEIWERGAGYTLASGSSSCAAAAVAKRLDLCDSDITVQMPGGKIEIRIDKSYQITMTGPVTPVATGTLCEDIWLHSSFQ